MGEGRKRIMNLVADGLICTSVPYQDHAHLSPDSVFSVYSPIVALPGESTSPDSHFRWQLKTVEA